MHNEPFIRLGIFLGLLIVMSTLEIFSPRRPLSEGRLRHWAINLSLTALNTLVLRLVLGAAAYETARVADAESWGALAFVDWPNWLEFLIAILVLDFALYVQHVMAHALPILWRLHRVHHSDVNLDATSGSRFHPVEILFSMLYKVAVVLALGPSALAVIVFEIVLNGSAVFHHANVRIPLALDRVLRLAIITPDLHRVHHSVIVGETNSNFGFSVPWWDRLCGTYCPQPRDGHDGMSVGIAEYRDPGELSLLRLLKLPFESNIGSYSFSGDDEG